MSGDCSPLRPIATWNPERVLWETGQIDLFTGLPEPFSEIWPTSGSMRNGSVYPRRLSGPAIDDSESSSSRGRNLAAPTAAAIATGGAPQDSKGKRDLRLDVLMFRTPTAQLGVNGGSQHPDKRRAGGHGPTLADEVEHLLPSPTVVDMGQRKTVEEWDAWTAAMRARHGNGNGHGLSLSVAARRLAH